MPSLPSEYYGQSEGFYRDRIAALEAALREKTGALEQHVKIVQEQRDDYGERWRVVSMALRRYEWVCDTDLTRYCPECERRENRGHTSACELAALLSAPQPAAAQGKGE